MDGIQKLLLTKELIRYLRKHQEEGTVTVTDQDYIGLLTKENCSPTIDLNAGGYTTIMSLFSIVEWDKKDRNQDGTIKQVTVTLSDDFMTLFCD